MVVRVFSLKTIKKLLPMCFEYYFTSLPSQVLVSPYAPGSFNPTTTAYIIQSMKFEGVSDFQSIRNDLSIKLSKVYLEAKQKLSRRRRRALRSIDSVVRNSP